MRFAAAVVTVVAACAPAGMVDAREQPTGPPTTLASQRPVSDDAVESAFPVDFVGVFYDGDANGGSVRFRHDGHWGPWVELEEDGVEVEGRWASALVPAADAEAYQVRVPGSARAARAVAINTTDGPARSAETASAACPDTTAVVTRCEWGADENLMTWGAPEFFPAQKLTVHHTASRNGDPDPAATVRATYRYQAVDLGYGDIGYHYLIDESGLVYEGRHSGDDGDPAHDSNGNVVTAAHVGGYNSGNVGIALLGTLTSVDPQPGARAALEGLLTELSVRHGIDPYGTSMYVNPVSGVTKSVANISGHRDWAATECPGGHLYALLPTIRAVVAGDPPPDTTPPVISSIAVATGTNTATVTWTTNEPSTGLVEYRRSKSTLWTPIPADGLTTTHTVAIGGLSRRTSYQYRASSTDQAGNTATSAIKTFKTR